MLAFLDESGDTGRKINLGSSVYFIISIVIFLDDDEAMRCDQRIELLKSELGLPLNYEFHFSNNSHKARMAFLNAINPYNFVVITVAIDKSPDKLYGDGFNIKNSFYKYACQLVLANSLPYMDKAILVLDKSGSSTFQGELKKYLIGKLNDQGSSKIKKIKSQPSHKNNLIQLADYCVGVNNRKIQNKKNWQSYYKYIAFRQVSFQKWPK